MMRMRLDAAAPVRKREAADVVAAAVVEAAVAVSVVEIEMAAAEVGVGALLVDEAVQRCEVVGE